MNDNAQTSAQHTAMVNHLRWWYRKAIAEGDDTAEEIRITLAVGGEVVYPPGTPEYAEYSERLTAALREFSEQA